jgi:Bacterial TSP3 repeat/Right handed beta helix region
MPRSRSHRPWCLLARLGPLLLAALLLAPFAHAASDRAARHRAASHRAARHRAAWARLRADPDHDRLSTRLELRRYHTNPHRFDTDGDGYGDGAEVRAGTNPRNPNSHPGPFAPPKAGAPAAPPAPSPPAPPSSPAPAPPAEERPPQPPPPSTEPPKPCTQTLTAGANVSTAIANAAAGSVLCLPATSTSFSLSQVDKSATVTVRGGGGTVGHSVLRSSSNLRFEGIRFVGGLELLGATRGIEIVDDDFTGPFGIHAGGEAHTVSGSKVSDVLIEGNDIHDLDYTGSQGVANGYGITASDGVADFVIRGNTIKSPASDYIQSASPVGFLVDHNTFLGPSLLGSHADHQDLWQIFGGGEDITFTDNVARDTETQESLLFQEGAFTNVVIENNLFDHDSRGYTCQIYQSTGLLFRDNTIVGSRWGCLFRDLSGAAPGSGYQVDHNVFAATAEGADVSTEGRAGSWGSYDYNVSEDGSAGGAHSVRNWRPSWADAGNFIPAGLPFTAGYRP